MAPNKRSAEQLQEERAASEWLIQQLDIKRQTFNKGNRPLLPKENELFRSWFDVLRETAISLANRSRSRRSVRVQARDFLGLIFLELGPEVFLLFTLTISVTKLVEIKCENLIPDVRSWWRDCLISEGLKEAASEACKANSISALIAPRSNASNDGENGSSPSEGDPAPNNALSRPTQQQHDAMQDVRHIAPTQAPQVSQVEATNESLGRQESSRQPSQISSIADPEPGTDTQIALRAATSNVKKMTYKPPRLAVLRDGDLLSFLETHQGAYSSLAIRVPADDDGNESPSIEISREMCQDLILHVMESTMQRSQQTQGLG